IYANPFGLSAASDKALSEELSRIRAYLSPVPPTPITVVEIDYDSIRILHETENSWMAANDWPIGYDHHARIMRDLSMPKGAPPPTALFYAIFFERPHVMKDDIAIVGRTLARLATNPAAPTIHMAGGGETVPMDPAAYQALKRPALTPIAWEA